MQFAYYGSIEEDCSVRVIRAIEEVRASALGPLEWTTSVKLAPMASRYGGFLLHKIRFKRCNIEFLLKICTPSFMLYHCQCSSGNSGKYQMGQCQQWATCMRRPAYYTNLPVLPAVWCGGLSSVARMFPIPFVSPCKVCPMCNVFPLVCFPKQVWSGHSRLAALDTASPSSWRVLHIMTKRCHHWWESFLPKHDKAGGRQCKVVLACVRSHGGEEGVIKGRRAR